MVIIIQGLNKTKASLIVYEFYSNVKKVIMTMSRLLNYEQMNGEQE